MTVNPKTFTIGGFVLPGHSIVLKSVNTIENEEGKSVNDGKFEQIAELIKLNGKYGEFLMNPLAEEDRDNMDTYFVSETKPEKRGHQYPVALLKRSAAGSDESEIICGLFTRQYDDGSVALTGKNRDTGVKYAIFLNAQKDEANKQVVNG